MEFEDVQEIVLRLLAYLDDDDLRKLILKVIEDFDLPFDEAEVGGGQHEKI